MLRGRLLILSHRPLGRLTNSLAVSSMHGRARSQLREHRHPRSLSSATSNSVGALSSDHWDAPIVVVDPTSASSSWASRSRRSMSVSASELVNLPRPCRWVSPIGPRALRKSA